MNEIDFWLQLSEWFIGREESFALNILWNVHYAFMLSMSLLSCFMADTM